VLAWHHAASLNRATPLLVPTTLQLNFVLHFTLNRGISHLSATHEPRREYMARLIKMVFDWLFKSNAADSFDIFESKIDGEFHGWSGNTLFALSNGQIWQQTSYALTRHYAYSPKVVIYRSGTAIKIKVDGVDQTICIKRIK
jgi:hypothetical protein